MDIVRLTSPVILSASPFSQQIYYLYDGRYSANIPCLNVLCILVKREGDVTTSFEVQKLKMKESVSWKADRIGTILISGDTEEPAFRIST